ncbi:MAG: ABC transporter substrate-binding protein [Sedimentisphaerales bacterium]|nr:ABC transporter substrate-binding protein [Sedimentisphaerales bacterium]MBN2844065.1 ABC transporter substrate-binding protein [Sedimentisphaerales bacterium]
MKSSRIIKMAMLLLAGLTLNVSAEKVKLSSLDWEPYVGKKIAENGFVSVIVTESFKAAGSSDISLFFLPWEKAVEITKVGNADGYYPEYYSKDLASEFILSDPMPCGPLVFIKLKTTEFKYTGKVEELKPYKIGIVAGYVNTEEIDKATDLTKVEAKDDSSNIMNLLGGKVDVAIVDPLVTNYYMKNNKAIAASLDKIEVVEPYLDHKQLYIAFSRKTADGEAKAKLFNDGLKKIKENGTLESILKKYEVADIVKYPAEKK